MASIQEDLENAAQLGEFINDELNIPVPDMRKIMQYMLIFIRLLSTPVRVIIHYNLGERAISPMSILFHAGLIFLAATLLGGGAGAYGFATVFVIAAVIHLVVIWKRRIAGKQWHSRSMGESYGFLKYIPFAKNDYILTAIYEPLIFIAIAWGVTFSTPEFMGYIVFVAMMVSMQVQLEYNQTRDAYLDQVDSKLDGEVMQAMLEGKELTNTKGVRNSGGVVGTLSGMSKDKREKLLVGIGVTKTKQDYQNNEAD